MNLKEMMSTGPQTGNDAGRLRALSYCVLGLKLLLYEALSYDLKEMMSM